MAGLAQGSIARVREEGSYRFVGLASLSEEHSVFVGHYGVSYGGKVAEARVPLWVLFIAVQFLDVLWGIFVLVGLERVRIVPGITATNPLDLYYMPYTHSLTGAIFWSVVAAFLYYIWRGRREVGRGSFVVALAVFSHWVLDLLVHRPDLPLIGDRFKVGLGLWNIPALAFGLETLFLVAGLALYMRSTSRLQRGGTAGPLLFVILMLAVHTMAFFGAPPGSPTAAAVMALVSYAGLAGIAAWLETRRGPVEALEPA